MSKGQRLRALVNERLTAAAEDIFALFERTIAEYEEELCRSKEENERKQQLLDSVLSPRVELNREAGIQSDLPSQKDTGAIFNWKNTETAPIKKEPEEQNIYLVEEQLPEFTAVCVKSEAQSSLLQQRQTEHREETQGAESDYIFDPFEQYYSENNNAEEDGDWAPTWEPPASSSTQQMEPEADGDDYNQVRIKDSGHKSVTPQNLSQRISANSDVREQIKPFPCSFCKKRFTNTNFLKIHTRVHTGEKPYSCPICKKCFTQSCNLRTHMKTHSGEKPFCCTVCSKCFLLKSHLNTHMRTHTGEKPYSCSVCNQSFRQLVSLKIHMEKTHWQSNMK